MTGAINALNTRLVKVGEVINGTITPATVPTGTEIIIGTIDLPAGCWMIMARIWLPEIITMQLYISNTGTDNGILGMFRAPMIVGYTSSTIPRRHEIVITQWSNVSIQVNSGAIYAFRIA